MMDDLDGRDELAFICFGAISSRRRAANIEVQHRRKGRGRRHVRGRNREQAAR